ncbi:NAD(P)-dependent oxidoreductase [Pseudomonas sp. MS19]|uniref:NAD-dependent epimerase/dehydratase family protein n=1 Tax=Pseudomonas sp. MS19 TaxID=2579939 RepID=UPI001562562A|nr:NAD(P)-dependent oxidoreductase [Pseudomonas sp. MS19]NRH26816.1 NAD(P)-dependent oxidoreductase [Pseudomonas sp. MS19]
MSCAVIFGGTGFIGSFFSDFLIKNNHFDKVYLYDLEGISDKASDFRRSLISSNINVVTITGDVRSDIDWFPEEPVTLIANFAAVHREPGHNDCEYYETNLLGAENICAWAEKTGCDRLIFTSSISPYGSAEAVKDESAIPVPTSPYGGSKLVAEYIHRTWQARDQENRQLVIVRPGVVFGPGEGGNVSRLIKAVLHRYFFYMGNRSTCKAGVYVKELCNAMWWVLQRQDIIEERVSLFNMSMDPGPSIEDYVATVCKVTSCKRMIIGIPYPMILAAAYIIEMLAKPFAIKHPFSPVRIKKLVRSNNISPGYLTNNGYLYIYTLESAFSDWKKSCPEEWN